MAHSREPWHPGYIGEGKFRREVVFDKFSGQVVTVITPGEQGKDDAQLIAAAPDLLTVAEGSLGYLESLPPHCKPDEQWLKPLREAIHKAGGRSKVKVASPRLSR